MPTVLAVSVVRLTIHPGLLYTRPFECHAGHVPKGKRRNQRYSTLWWRRDPGVIISQAAFSSTASAMEGAEGTRPISLSSWNVFTYLQSSNCDLVTSLENGTRQDLIGVYGHSVSIVLPNHHSSWHLFRSIRVQVHSSCLLKLWLQSQCPRVYKSTFLTCCTHE